MKVTGIIVEYSPLHHGHVHHIKEAKRITDCDVLVAVMSPHFTQRGDVACVDKFIRTEAALRHGVDVVFELPTIYATQNASVFANKAMEILHLAQADSFVFGSESNDLKTLQEIANLPVNVDYFKEKMSQGYSYPAAIALEDQRLYPNDILGVAYLKAAQKFKLKPYSIQRTNHYHDLDFNQEILSASAIRQAYLDGLGETQSLVSLDHFVSNKDIYPLLRYQLLTNQSLKDIFMVNEGIENMLVKNAQKYDDYEDFINASISRRYSRSRIQRTCVHILLGHTKSQIQSLSKEPFLRVLGFNKKVAGYLKKLDNVSTKVKEMPEDFFKLEMKATQVYELVSTKKTLVKQEVSKVFIL